MVKSSWQLASHRNLARATWKVSFASSSRPPWNRSGLVRSTSRVRLSGCTVELKMSGRCPSSVNRSRERKRVSKWNSPAGLCSTSTMSPDSSNMAKLSPCFRVRRLEAASETTPGTMTGPVAASFSRFIGFARLPAAKRAVHAEVVPSHARSGEARLEAPAHLRPVERRKRGQPRHRRIDRVHQEPGDAVFNDFGHRAIGPGEHRRAAGHRFDHRKAEGLGPVDGKEKAARVAEEAGLV